MKLFVKLGAESQVKEGDIIVSHQIANGLPLEALQSQMEVVLLNPSEYCQNAFVTYELIYCRDPGYGSGHKRVRDLLKEVSSANSVWRNIYSPYLVQAKRGLSFYSQPLPLP